ncbi:UNVERIFIED_CONTAM: Retrovirus-related Pol polyprotein from type-2 retrotransposable element R2DM, partial [Sesamum indicum]
MKPPVNVYVPKGTVSSPQPPAKERKTTKPVVEDIPKADAGDRHVDQNHSKKDERGKAIVIYNAFDALHIMMMQMNIQGVLTQAAPYTIIHVEHCCMERPWAEQTRPSARFEGPAWDENVVDVHILDLADQFIHYRVTNMAVNESIIITVVYGASKVNDRRNLWTALETLAQQCSDVPWMVGGAFNAVRDLNEVCGISGDIRMATEEFNAGILEAGLIPLPMQGEWFTWHNCSISARSLWKRLDRVLINDRWLSRFPSAYYHSLTPRTSDHSPLVLHGDIQQLTENIWNHEIVGIPMYAVTCKLKALKPVFRLQRRNKGDLTLNLQLAKDFLDETQQLVSSDRQNELYLLLEHCCRIVYAKAAKLEQIMLQQRAKMQWMKDGDQCSRVFFRKIAQRRVIRRILQINDENGTTHTDQGEVAHVFVSYFQNLLGGTRRRLTVDIQYLRPWVRHCITDEEASHLLLPFSPDDVKQAVFDIAEDKAPGPDGYSSWFFKVAWPVVGEEVTRVVLDFFSTGKLLKQINSTILTLIPKRLSVLLDKIINPCQTAFIPGRSIGDNIMLAQELFSGYNQMRLPPRCALKVDIRKAYDTVEWDFLLAVLQLFGFQTTFTRWIEECVSTTSFLIGLNGKPHGFFPGARGLRQGDPLSPYLFDMQFTYHWKCESSKVFQLGFADDLLLFSRANFDSIRVFKEFERPNVGDFELSRGTPSYKEFRYHTLGEYNEIWLSALSLYWPSAFILPKKVINVIEKRLGTFLWKGMTFSGYAKVAWKNVCRPTDEGGLGFKDIATLNCALMSKKLCDVIRCDRTSICVQWLYQDRLRDTSIWTVREHGGSWGWRKMLRLRPFLRSIVKYQIGDGGKFYIWLDPWHHLGPLIEQFPRGPNHLGIEESAKFNSVISAGEWQWPPITDFECLEITHNLLFIFG